MPVKPFLMSDLRKSMTSSPAGKHRDNIGTGNYNRFNPLASKGRTLSVGKRLLSDDDVTPASPKMPRFDSNLVFEKLASQDKLLEEAKVAMAEAKAVMDTCFKAEESPLGNFFAKLSVAVEKIILHSEATKSSLVDLCKVPDPPLVRRTNPLPTSSATKVSFQPAAQVPKVIKTKPVPTPEDTAASKVKRVLREAERRTVIFELDLGAAPTINKESISKKVTMALHSKAASGEHDWNIKDAGEMVDDVLSCSQLEFLGSGTRKFFNNKKATDKRNGTMCTVPVRMDFKNKETRIQAESTLRNICKVSCSTPYPKKLRAMLGRAILEGKKTCPETYIRTRIDVDNLTVTASARVGATWSVVYGPVPIPLDVLDPNTIIPVPEQPEVSTMDTVENPIPTNTPASSTPVS